ncbi:hypothetical protein SAMN05192541_14627 [Bradyrhizobium arachidis]|nr:hypothetical protein SAMN05192541_14627 [Bradyrhizobium arachidis]
MSFSSDIRSRSRPAVAALFIARSACSCGGMAGFGCATGYPWHPCPFLRPHELHCCQQPLALALLNVLFLAGFMLLLREISASAQRRDQVMMRLAEKCAIRNDR